MLYTKMAAHNYHLGHNVKILYTGNINSDKKNTVHQNMYLSTYGCFTCDGGDFNLAQAPACHLPRLLPVTCPGSCLSLAVRKSMQRGYMIQYAMMYLKSDQTFRHTLFSFCQFFGYQSSQKTTCSHLCKFVSLTTPTH